MTHQTELDKGILEKLMSKKLTNQAEMCQNRLLNNNNNNNTTKNNKINNFNNDDDDDDDDDEDEQINQKFENDLLALVLNQDNIKPPIVQVINIQNIATSAVVTKYNQNNNNDNKSTSSSCSSSSNETEETKESSKNQQKQNSKNKKKSPKHHKNTTFSSDRYLLILSDGEYYETRCLLLPSLNHLVNSCKLRQGSIIKLDRFELNPIPNGKILVIEALTVLDNTINNTNQTNNDNERKSIINNRADTLKSIGIGSLKPTSNNTQLKIRLQQPSEQINNTTNHNENNSNKNELTDKNNNKNKFNKQEEDELDDDDDDEYEDVDDDDEELDENDDDDDEFEDEDYEDDDDDDDEEDDYYEDEEDKDNEKNFKSVVDIILCKCSSCKEQNTLKLCYKLLDLDENANIEQVKEKYLMLVENRTNNLKQYVDIEINDTNTNNNPQNALLVDTNQNTECNLDKLIRKLLKKKIFTITDSDRQEIRSKAYNLILKIKSNDDSTTNVPINTLLSTLTISKASSILNNIDRKLLIRKRIVNNTETNNNNNNNNYNQEAQIEDYLQYAWMKIANEFIRHEKQQIKTSNINNNNTDNSNQKNTKQLELKMLENMNSNNSSNNKTVKQMNEIKSKKSNEQFTNETNCNTTAITKTTNNNHLNHHHHHHHLNCRRRINRNPKAFYQQIKKNNKTHSIKAMRNKQKQEATAAAALAAASTASSSSSNVEVAAPSPFVYSSKKEDESEVNDLMPFDCKLGNFLVDFNNRQAILNDILNDKFESKENQDLTGLVSNNETSKKEDDLIKSTENTSLTISNNNNKNNNSTNIKRIEKDLEQHLDSLKLIKEKLSLNYDNTESNENTKTTTAKKRKNDNSLVLASSITTNQVIVKQDEKNNIIKQQTITSHNSTSNKNKKNKKKKNKKTTKISSGSSQLNIAIPSFSLPNLLNETPSTTTNSNINDHDLILKDKLKLELEREQLEKQLIEQQKLNKLQIEQLLKQIDEIEADSAAAAAVTSNVVSSSSEQVNVLETVLNENDLNQVNLNNVKSNDDNKNISESLKSLDRIEKLKKLESIQKVICSQDFTLFKEQQKQQQTVTTEILKSKLMQLEKKKLNKKCLSCSKTDQTGLSLIKLNEKDKSLFKKLKNVENYDDDISSNDDDYDDDDCEGVLENNNNNNNNNQNSKDQFNIIIMKQTKQAQFNENNLKQTTTNLMLSKSEKRRILIKDVVKQLNLVNSKHIHEHDDDDIEEEDDDEYDEDDDDDNYEGENDEYYEDDENENKTSIPSVEDLITIHDDEENIIFVQSLSSLAKKTLFNQQLNQQPKQKRKQQANKDFLIESNTVIHLSSNEQIKSNSQLEANIKKNKEQQQQQQTKQDAELNKNEKKVSESSTTTATTIESIKLSKSQKKRIKKQLNKKNSLANTTTNSESVPETTIPQNNKETMLKCDPSKNVCDQNENKNSKQSKKKKQETPQQSQQQKMEQNIKNNETPSSPSTTTQTSSNNKKTKKSKKKSSETNNSNKNQSNVSNKHQQTTNKTEVEKTKQSHQQGSTASKKATKRINDISDFSEPDEEVKNFKKDSEIYDSDTNSQQQQRSKTNLKTVESNESNISNNEDSDQGGDWVKVAGNRLLIAETKKSNKNIEQAISLTNSLTNKKTVKISNSLNSLDSFTSQDMIAHSLKKIQTTDSDNKSKKNEKLSTVDLLVPSTIDEEDEMLKKALELSLKETKLNTPPITDMTTNTTKKTSAKLGLDDFDDFPIKSKVTTPTPTTSQVKTPQNVKSALKQTISTQPVAKSSNQSSVKSNLIKPVTTASTVLTSNRQANTTVTSFAAAAASQPKIKQVSSTIIPSQSVGTLNQSKQPFKWNKPSETIKTNLVEPVVKISSNSTDSIIKRKTSSSSSKDFKSNGVDILDVVTDKQTTSSLPLVTSNLEQLSLNSFNKTEDQSLNFTAPVSNQFLTINNMFTTSPASSEVTSSKLDTSNKSDIYGVVSDIKSPLITPSSFGTLLTSSIIGSGISSNLLASDQTSNLPVINNTISPIKKPIGAERSMNTQRSNNSISPPLIKLPIPAPVQLPNAALVHPIRPASTAAPTVSSSLTPAKPLNTQLSTSNTTLNSKPMQIILPQTNLDLTSSLTSPNQTNLTDSSASVSMFKPEIAPNQKQMIRVPPQQKLTNSVQQQGTSSIHSADQLNKLKLQQQLQQQQQQTYLNNLVLLLASNNINNMDPNQLANIILYLNQLMSQQPQINSTEANFQSKQQTLNDTTSLLLKNLIHQQQQQQQTFNVQPNSAASWNNFDNFSQQNLSKPVIQTSNLQQQQLQTMFSTHSKPNTNLWQNNDYQSFNKSTYSTSGLITTSNSTPSPPPVTNSTTSSSSSIIMQSGSSTSSSPSPHLINPLINNTSTSQYPSTYNYFGSNNSNIIGNTNSSQNNFQLNNKHSLIQGPNQNLIVGSSNMQYKSNSQLNNNNNNNNNAGVNQLYSSFNNSIVNAASAFNTGNSFFSMNNNSNNLMTNFSNVVGSNSNTGKLLPNPIGVRSSTSSNSTQQLHTPLTQQIPKNSVQTSFIRNNQHE